MKAEYICADQPVTLIFRLRQRGGPYMPVGRQIGTCIRWLESGREPPLLWVTFTAQVIIL